MQKATPGNKNNLIHSNSTSHLLHREQRKTEQLEETKKRFSSSEGRFHIIDERSKDSSASSDTDEDAPLPNVFSVPNRLPPAPIPAVGFSQSVNLPHGHMSSVSSASRFRIVPVVPVESRYKRGRWDCFDYYQKEIPRGSKVMTITTAPRTLSTLTKNGKAQKNPSEFQNIDRTVCSWTTELAPMPATAPPHGPGGPTFKFDETEKTLPKHKALNVVVVEQVNMTPTEMLQTGLATTLNTAEIKKNSCVITSSAASHNGNSPHSVAIDSKIEQAMDLVKSHLMFAVREEVESLRQKIGELEIHIHNLETENAILKNHISPDVLGGLHTTLSK